MKTDPLLDEYLPDTDDRRTRQVVIPTDRETCATMVRDDDGFREPLPGVPGQCREPRLVRRYRGAVGDVPSTVLREDEQCFVVGAVGRRIGPVLCWLAATPGAVRTMDEPGHCRVANATVFRDHAEGALLAQQVRLAWTDDGPPDAIEDAMKLALGNGVQRRLDRLAEGATSRT